MMASSPLPIITKIATVAQFQQILADNPGVFLLKFTATWCGPCKTIEPLVMDVFRKLPANFQCANIDIDQCPEIYNFLKNKKMVNGIPVILCYRKGNLKYIPDDSVIGSNMSQLKMFFDRCFGNFEEW